MVQRVEIDREAQMRARRFYEAGGAVAEVAALMRVSATTARRRAREWGWSRTRGRRRAARSGPGRAALHAGVEAAARAGVASGEAAGAVAGEAADAGDLAARIRRVVEREIAALEAALARAEASEPGSGEAERAARVLASLARTMNELTKMEAATRREERPGADSGLDALRAELTRRLRRLPRKG